jgi:hypothetical protein
VTEFAKVLRQAIETLGAQRGVSPGLMTQWLLQLRDAADNPEAEQRLMKKVERELGAAFRNAIRRGSLNRYHFNKPENWEIERLGPELRRQLEDRVWAAQALIRGRRDVETAEALQRFTGYVTSAARAEAGFRRTQTAREAAAIAKPLMGELFETRRIMVDQVRKLQGSLNLTIAEANGAIGGIWDAERAIKREHRPNHLAWGEKGLFFSLKDNWAEQKGLVKRPNGDCPAAYIGDTYSVPPGKTDEDETVAAGQCINCRCAMRFLYSLGDVEEFAPGALTKDGEKALRGEAA